MMWSAPAGMVGRVYTRSMNQRDENPARGSSSGPKGQRGKRLPGGFVHTYRKYDPQRFPLPDAEPPDLVSPAFEHMLAFGSMEYLSPEQLAEAIEIDPREIAGLGPSIESLRAMLEERKQRLLQTYETTTVVQAANRAFEEAGRRMNPPKRLRERFERALRSEQTIDFERLWYRVEQRSPFARALLQLNQRLIDRDEIEELDSKYEFSGRRALSISEALEVKEELETIDELLKQLEQAAKDAKVYVIDMDALARFAEEADLEQLRGLQQQVEEMLRRQAEEQGIMGPDGTLQLTPRAYKLFQNKVLDQIFGELQAGKSGRHRAELSGDGAVELQRTKRYAYGDSLANMDVPGSMLNAMLREGAGVPVRMRPDDIEIHLTRNAPKCATSVIMDMSGSMQYGGLYVHVKRMGLALHGLIRSEYPGDFLDFIEIATLAKLRHPGELVELMPKPVTIRDPVVRLRADMSDPEVSEVLLPPHFTNIQHGLQLARRRLSVQDTPNRQILLITDGLPTAHFESEYLYMLYPPHEQTAHHTMREGLLCREAGIVINIFLLSTWSQSSEDIQFAHQLAEATAGRVFFVTGGELERFVVWDYLSRRRSVIG